MGLQDLGIIQKSAVGRSFSPLVAAYKGGLKPRPTVKITNS